METSRREALKVGAAAAVVGVLSPLLRSPAEASVHDASEDSAVEGFSRPYGFSCVCLPPQEWATHGDWVMRQTLDLLQPDHWHSWGTWPDSDYPGRIPMVFATRYFDHDSVRRRMTANSGEVWMLPNEPELPQQANETPRAIADLTCKLIQIGQESGSTWQWGSPAITLSTEHNGLAWLTEWIKIMRQEKGVAKPFTWFIHPYTCNSVSALHASMDAWWEWYQVWGQGAPVVISELCAEDAGPDVHADVMLECYKMLRSGAVKGVFWFAAYRSMVEEQSRQRRIPWQHYPLCTLDHGAQTVALTELGQYWKELQ